MQRARNAYTLMEVLLVLAIIGMGCLMFVIQSQPTIKQGKTSVAQQQAIQIQTAFEQWAMSEPTLADARTAFNPLHTSTATAPQSQVAFFQTYLAPNLEPTVAQDIINNSTATQLSSTDMQAIGAYATLYWNSNYTANQPQVNLTIP